MLLLSLLSLLFLSLACGEEMVPCPYPPASEIHPCECLTSTDDAHLIQLFCFWDFGEDHMQNQNRFKSVLNKFDSYTNIDDMEMVCVNCYNFQFDGILDNSTTGRFNIKNMTFIDFEASDDVLGDQFTESAFSGSQDSLEYLIIKPYHYFSPHQSMLKGLSKLKELILYGIDARINGFPDLSSLSSLNKLELYNSYIDILDVPEFSQHPTIKSIKIANSELHQIRSGFNNNTQMEYLSITGNNITSITKGTFSNLPSLISLDLSNNNLDSIADSFVNINAGAGIVLNGNKLVTLPEETWKVFITRKLSLPSNSSLPVMLEDNPLDCGCDIKWLVVDLPLAVPLFENAVCANGVPLSQVDADVINFFCPDKY